MQSENNIWYRFTPDGIDWAVTKETRSTDTGVLLVSVGTDCNPCRTFESLKAAVNGLMGAGFDLLSESPLESRVIFPPRTLP